MSGEISFTYGYAVTKDIVERERQHATAHLLRRKIEETRDNWRRVFVEEMCELLREEQP